MQHIGRTRSGANPGQDRHGLARLDQPSIAGLNDQVLHEGERVDVVGRPKRDRAPTHRQLAQGPLVRTEGDDGHRRTEPCRRAHRESAVADADDRGDAHLGRGTPRSGGHGIGQLVVGAVADGGAAKVADAPSPGVVVELLISALSDTAHGGDGVHGIGADRAFGGEHDRRGAVEDGVGDVGDLGSGRRRRGDHGFEHLRSGDDGLAAGDALAGDLLLEVRKLLDAELGAQIAAGDHDAAGRVDDPLEVLDRSTGLDLGDDQRASRVGLGADAPDVVGGAHEADGDHVDAFVDERVEQPQVLGRRRRHAQPVRGDVEARATLNRPSVQHAGLGGVAVDGLDAQDHAAVADREPVAGVHVGEQVVVVDAEHRGV